MHFLCGRGNITFGQSNERSHERGFTGRGAPFRVFTVRDTKTICEGIRVPVAGILVAVGIVCSPLSIPVGASKCAPVQHFINILGGVFLGPGYAVGMAFVTSLLRNLMGTGTLLAFPGSMCGALLCGLLYKYGKHLPFAYVGELFGTSVIGGLLSYPIATLIMGSESAVFGFVIPFFVSSCGGTIIAAVLVTAMKKMKVFDVYLGNLDAEPQKIKH